MLWDSCGFFKWNDLLLLSQVLKKQSLETQNAFPEVFCNETTQIEVCVLWEQGRVVL